MKYLVFCVCKDSDNNIVSVGGIQGGSVFRFDRATVADMINKGDKFYTVSNGETAEVRVYDQTRKFIKTWADGDWNDNLDNLTICPNCQ